MPAIVTADVSRVRRRVTRGRALRCASDVKHAAHRRHRRAWRHWLDLADPDRAPPTPRPGAGWEVD